MVRENVSMHLSSPFEGRPTSSSGSRTMGFKRSLGAAKRFDLQAWVDMIALLQLACYVRTGTWIDVLWILPINLTRIRATATTLWLTCCLL